MEQPIPPTRTAPTITVIIEPEGKTQVIPRCKTVRQLLAQFSLGLNSALVIRDNALLTPDRRINANDTITLRIVTSSG